MCDNITKRLLRYVQDNFIKDKIGFVDIAVFIFLFFDVKCLVFGNNFGLVTDRNWVDKGSSVFNFFDNNKTFVAFL